VRIAAEVEDVTLGKPEMFDQLPRRVGQSHWLQASKARRNALDRGIEVHVSVVPAQERAEVLSETNIRVHANLFRFVGRATGIGEGSSASKADELSACVS